MKEDQINLEQWAAAFEAGEFDKDDVHTQCYAGWWDWFCKDSSLKNKTAKLGKKVLAIIDSPKIDKKNMYVFFKNNCPVMGSLYDDFRICDLRDGEVVFTVIPSDGHTKTKGRAEVWGRQNDFEKPLVVGTWKDVKKFFQEK